MREEREKERERRGERRRPDNVYDVAFFVHSAKKIEVRENKCVSGLVLKEGRK